MTFTRTWSDAWGSKAFRVHAIVTALLLPVVLRTLAVFLIGVEARPGVVLPDPILRLFQAQDVTWVTFSVIYGGLIAGIVILLRSPQHLLLAMQTYIVMVAFRIPAMALVPLDPPAGAIALQDPFVEILGTGQLLTRDLFFSGHTSTLLLIGLAMPSPRLRLLYFTAAVFVGVCVLLQHDHYSIDVFAAPFFTYAAYRIVVLIHDRSFGQEGRRA